MLQKVSSWTKKLNNIDAWSNYGFYTYQKSADSVIYLGPDPDPTKIRIRIRNTAIDMGRACTVEA
jgi:hypothetical protein